MSTNIYTREECVKLIDELEIISHKVKIRLQPKKIPIKLMQSILFHTVNCRDNLSERIYWILNNIEDYPFCQECGKQFQPKFYGLKTCYRGTTFCSSKCISSNIIIQEKSKQTCLIRYGVEHSTQSKEIKEKSKQTCLERYGVENAFQSKEKQEKIKQTNLERLGVEYPSQSLEIQEKYKQTCLERYGVENPSQSEIIKQKKINTCLKNHSVEHALQSQKILKKFKETCLERYGVEYALQSLEIQEHAKQTCLEKYGVENPMQYFEIFERSRKNRFKLKKLNLPSGKIITYQGYENSAYLKLLDDGYLEEHIITKISDIPQIKYQFDNKDKIYFPDIFIPHENKIIEVKSTYTYKKDLEQNLAKRQACLDQGYQFEIWICSDKELLEIK